MLTNYMKTVRKSDYAYGKGFCDCNGDTIVNENEVHKITVENPINGFPLAVYQFVYNDKYFNLGSKFFDRPTEAMLEEMNAIRRAKQEYSLLLPCLLDALEKEDNKDKHTENMIRCGEWEQFHCYLEHMRNKEMFLANLLQTFAAFESQSNIYNFVLNTFKTMIKTSSCNYTIEYMKTALILSLYRICSTKDVRNVKATLDLLEENKIPILLYQEKDVSEFMFDAFLPVCLNNTNILIMACNNGHFYLVNLIIGSRHIGHLDCQSALMAACKQPEINKYHLFYHDKASIEIDKLNIVEYVVETIGIEKFDLKAACEQACSSKYIRILEWFLQKIDTPRLNVYTTINLALEYKRSDILEHIMNKVELENLDKRNVLKAVTEHYTVECSTTILEILLYLGYYRG
ncbi:unnamed protein product [Mytilus edulis]|uniref:Uncharacterized protein n=1 Tax=Mytilus edulis TaxID=6550 RepID=A0A8S3SBT5_MYTED|nr:unnamed protein product [Mytilus edulis]